MLKALLKMELLDHLPDFKVGTILYHNITVRELPQMMKGRLDLFYESERLSLEERNVADLPGVSEWRRLFKTFGTDPSRYRPSHEALIRRLKNGQPFPEINSAVDLNNFFSVRQACPMGLYDLAKINGNEIIIRVGNGEDHYEAINGRDVSMVDKLLSSDQIGAFGSPIVDSKRTMVTEETTNALHLIYFGITPTVAEAKEILEQIKEQFIQIHGGEALTSLLY